MRAKISQAHQAVYDAIKRLDSSESHAENLAVFYAYHGAILALDALCHHRGRPTPRRHHEAAATLGRMVRDRQVPENAARFRNLLASAASDRSAIGYDARYVSNSDARKTIRDIRAWVDYVEAQVA